MEQIESSLIESHKDRHFRGQSHEEHVLAFCRKHWTYLFSKFFVFFLVLALIVIFGFYFRTLSEIFSPGLFHLLVLTAGTILVYYVHRFFLILLMHHLTVIIITDLRIVAITKSVYFVNEKETVDLTTIRDVHKYQSGFFENLYNFGDLKITLATSSTVFELCCIPNPEFHLRLINKAKQQYNPLREEKPLAEG